MLNNQRKGETEDREVKEIRLWFSKIIKLINQNCNSRVQLKLFKYRNNQKQNYNQN